MVAMIHPCHCGDKDGTAAEGAVVEIGQIAENYVIVIYYLITIFSLTKSRMKTWRPSESLAGES